jgi:hypothetical protein
MFDPKTICSVFIYSIIKSQGGECITTDKVIIVDQHQAGWVIGALLSEEILIMIQSMWRMEIGSKHGLPMIRRVLILSRSYCFVFPRSFIFFYIWIFHLDFRLFEKPCEQWGPYHPRTEHSSP